MKFDRRSLTMLVLFLLAALMLSSPFIVRSFNGDPLFSYSGSYYNLRASEDIYTGVYWDPLESRIHKVSFANYFLGFLMSVTNMQGIIIISVIIGLLSLYIFFLITKRFYLERTATYTAFLFALSPMFLYLFTRINDLSLATFFLLLFFHFYLKKNYFSILFMVLIAVTSFQFFVAAVIILLCYELYSRKLLFLISNLVPGIIAFFIFAFYHKGFQIFANVFANPSLSFYFTSFGAKTGIPFFYLFLGFIGLFATWKRGREYSFFLLSLVIVFVFSFFTVVGKVVLNFYICFLAAAIIITLLRRNWAVIFIKRFSLLLVLCSVIFSTSLYTDQIINENPNSDLVNALRFLESQPDGVVFSHEKYGGFIQYFSEKKSFLDDNSFDYDNYFALKDTEQKIFYSRNLEQTEEILKESQIDYILITPEMKEGLVWKKSDEGLLFLLENSDHFSKLFSSGEITVWKHIGGFVS
ncbi:hypothetical protein H8D36_05060 [archaeon]|nr:hypothetical protein [archaeon]MBL7056766.1 hypothetical protein [Candidatus Woesearchaeota archaeon]